MVGVGGYECWHNHSFDGVYLAVVAAVVPSGGSHTAVVTMVILVLMELAMVVGVTWRNCGGCWTWN